MVSNEKTPKGTSIAERYGRPVTADDVEELLHRERVAPGTAAKVMQAVRAALTWNRAATVRPWAGELEDGLTRQEERRTEERRARLREQLLEESARRAGIGEGMSARAAAASAGSGLVNTPDPEEPGPEEIAELEELAEVITLPVQAELDWSLAEAPERHLEGPGSPVEEAGEVIAREEPYDAFVTLPSAVTEHPAEVAAAALRGEPVDVPAAAVQAAPPADAPPQPAAPARDVAEALPGVVVPPVPPDAPAALSGARNTKTCTRCGRVKQLEQFQRDARSSDGRRSACKMCTSVYDTLRKSLRNSLRQMAGDAALAAEEALEREGLLQPQEGAKEAPEPAGQATPPEPEEREPEVPVRPVAAVPGPVPETGGGELLRACKRCGVPKPESGYYQRRDGRLRFACRECEKQEAADRRHAKTEAKAK